MGSGTVESASAALEGIKKNLDTQATNLQNVEMARTPHSSQISLLGIGAFQPQMRGSPNPLEQARSLQALLEEVVHLRSRAYASMRPSTGKTESALRHLVICAQ